MFGLSHHIEYDREGRPVLKVYRSTFSSLYNPVVSVPLDHAYMIESLDSKTYSWRVMEIAKFLGLNAGKKPKEFYSRLAIWFLDRCTDLFHTKSIMPEPEKQVGEIDLFVNGDRVKTSAVMM